MKAEMGILRRTEELLKAKDSNAQEVLERLEKERGVSGYRGTVEELGKVVLCRSGIS